MSLYLVKGSLSVLHGIVKERCLEDIAICHTTWEKGGIFLSSSIPLGNVIFYPTFLGQNIGHSNRVVDVGRSGRVFPLLETVLDRGKVGRFDNIR